MAKLIGTLLLALLAAGCSRPREHSSVIEELPSPAGANAAEPFLFTTRDGIGLSWLEPVLDTDRVALRFAIHHNGRWSAPRTVVERSDLFVNWADFPSMVEDTNGVLFAHWLQKSGAGTYSYDVRMAVSKDRGATWGEPFLLNRDGREAEHGFVSLAALPKGGIGATWLDGRNMTSGDGHDGDHGDMTIRYANVDAHGALTADVELDARTCECCTTGMAMTASGPVIVYRDRVDEIRDISFVRSEAGAWSAPRTIRADGWTINGCPVNGPQIDAAGNVLAAAWFTAAKEQQRVYAAFSADGGKTFETAVVVDDGRPVGRVDVVMIGDDAAVVSWLEQTAAGAEIRARRVRRGREPEPAVKIADASTARAAGFTRMVPAGDQLWFTWTGYDGQNKKIHLARARF